MYSYYEDTGINAAPHTGAWIETFFTASSKASKASPPLTQGRGLKHQPRLHSVSEAEPPLTQGRGLKPYFAITLAGYNFAAPHTGAWIETCSLQLFHIGEGCRPSHRGVD